MFEPYIISKHALARYIERTLCKKSKAEEQLRKDLRFTNAKKIINNGNTKHIFTYSNKEFIFIKKNGKWILKTVIKRNIPRNKTAAKKREHLKLCS